MDTERENMTPETTKTDEPPVAVRSAEDAAYIESLKADMRRAAAARESSEALAEGLKRKLEDQALSHRLQTAALQAGCLDPEGLLGAATAKGLLATPPAPAQVAEWLAAVREAMPYFFATSRQPETEQGLGPVHAARPARPALNTQQLAARAYLR